MKLGALTERFGLFTTFIGATAIVTSIPIWITGSHNLAVLIMVTGMGVALLGVLGAFISLPISYDENTGIDIPDEELTPEQQLRKRELEMQQRRQQQEGVAKAAELLFSNRSGSGDSERRAGRSNRSLTNTFKRASKRYTGGYLGTPQCPTCGSEETSERSNDTDVYQCDKCGHIFEMRSQTRRDINLNIED